MGKTKGFKKTKLDFDTSTLMLFTWCHNSFLPLLRTSCENNFWKNSCPSRLLLFFSFHFRESAPTNAENNLAMPVSARHHFCSHLSNRSNRRYQFYPQLPNNHKIKNLSHARLPQPYSPTPTSRVFARGFKGVGAQIPPILSSGGIHVEGTGGGAARLYTGQHSQLDNRVQCEPTSRVFPSKKEPSKHEGI